MGFIIWASSSSVLVCMTVYISSDVPETRKAAVRKKAKLFSLEDGVLYYSGGKTGVKR